MKGSEFHWLMSQTHLRKMVDPHFRKEKQKENENIRISQWFDRYCNQALHYLQTEEQRKKYSSLQQRLRVIPRTQDAYIEEQFDFLFQTIKELLDYNQRTEAWRLKNEIMRTLGITHYHLKEKLNKLK